MPLTRSKVKQCPQQPSTSPAVSINENVVALGRKGGCKPKNEPCFDDKINPLLNDLLLTILFEYIKGQDLKPCRLVCKQWHHLTLPFVRDQFPITIFSPRQSKSRGIGHFMKLINSNTLGSPFNRYSLHFFHTTSGSGKQFLRTCANSAKEILIKWDDKQTVENVAEILKSAPKLESFAVPTNYLESKEGEGKVVELFPGPENTKPKLPFLKSLNIDGVSRHGDYACPTFNVELLQATQNISTLDLGKAWFSEESLEIWETIEKLGKESMITNLSICSVEEGHMKILRRMAQKEKGLKLKKLDLREDDLVGFELIEIFKNSLIDLRVNGHCDYGSIPFPHMPKLKRLHFVPFKHVRLTCDNFGYLFPSLEKLYIDFTQPSNPIRISIVGTEPCPTYKSSVLRCAKIKMENLNGILTFFPTLTFLQCEIDLEDGAEVIRNILTHLSHLESLSLSGTLNMSENLDSLVTGIPVQQLKKFDNMDKFVNSLPQMDISNREVRIRNQRKMMTKNSELPSIRNLTNLRSLALRLTGKAERIPMLTKYFTDLTAYFGFYALNNLRHLNMSPCEFSKSCSEILVTDKCLMNWEFKSPSNQEIISTEWNKRTVPDYAENF